MDITGRKLFVKALQEEGVDTIFAYPGGMVTDIVDELYKQDSIHVVLPRHEQALIHEAEGYARATGRVGVCLVTSGPGATNTITGIADAHYDSIPLVIFTGQVPQNLIGNDAFQEVDIVGMTRSIVKYGVTVRDRKDLGKIIKMAFQIASSGKPGPVLIDIPKDIQTQNGPAGYPDHVDIRGYKPNETVHIGQLKKAYKILKSAKQPLLLAGGGVNISGAQELLTTFAEKMHIPVVTTVMGKGAIPTDHPLYVGNSGMHGKYAANMAVSQRQRSYIWILMHLLFHEMSLWMCRSFRMPRSRWNVWWNGQKPRIRTSGWQRLACGRKKIRWKCDETMDFRHR